VAGFADATGRFLPLVCTLNAARVLTSAAALLGVDFDEFAALAMSAEPGSGGLVLLPYLDGERTPNLPDARGSLHGITRANLTPQNLARAAIEGMFGGLADAVDALVAVGVTPRRVILVGGAAANAAVSEVASTMFTVPVEAPPPGEYVADGAARQAQWARSGSAEPPRWSDARPGATIRLDAAPISAIREAYAAARTSLYG
jgi:xylulokinase